MKRLFKGILTFSFMMLICLSIGLFGEFETNKMSAAVRDIELEMKEVDSQSIFSEFKETELIYVEEDNYVQFSGIQTLDSSILNEIDLISVTNDGSNELDIKYSIEFDADDNLVYLTVTAVNSDIGEIVDRIVGVPFLNEKEEVDIAFSLEDEIIYLSEFEDYSVLENCGWFSKFWKKFAPVAAVVLTVAVVVTVVVVAAPAVVAAVPTVSTVALAGGGTATVLTGGGAAAAMTAASAAAAAYVPTIAATTAGVLAVEASKAAAEATSESTSGACASSSASPQLPGNKNNKKSDKDKTKDLSEDVSDDYKVNGKCDKYADALENKMRENNISGERIKVKPKTGKDIIYSDKNGVIGNNGYHDAIKVGDYVFDNMNPQGVSYNDWLADLGGDYYNIFEIIRSW